MTDADQGYATRNHRYIYIAGILLGIALGGFFDGILLHQILQWHHLLSGLENGRLDLAQQVLFDGLFHALMYVLMLIGLVMLWGQRKGLDMNSGGRLLSAVLLGFGIWHVLDAVLSHWILGLHRIHPESANPLFWDLLFLGLGVLCMALSQWGWRANHMAVSIIIMSVLSLGVASALPWRSSDTVAVVFNPASSASENLKVATTLGASLVSITPDGRIWTFRMKDARDGWRFYGAGAWLVTGTYGGMGCFVPKAGEV